MEEKKVQRLNSSLWPVSGFWNFLRSFFLKKHHSLFSPRSFLVSGPACLPAGLTLIELLVVITILGIFIAVAMAALDPIAQFTKVNDAKRLHNLGQIRTALDSYFNDAGVYPTTIPFGASFTSPPGCTIGASGCTLYIKNVPQDPGIMYMSSAAQWAVLFARQKEPNQVCALTQVTPSPPTTNCLPSNYNNNWYCITLGSVNCSSIQGRTLP